VRETGERVTRLRLGEKAPVSARILRRSASLVFGPIRRAAKRLLRGMVGAGSLEVTGKPLVVRIQPAFTANIGGGACDLYTGALQELVRIYAGREREVSHRQCVARGDAVCEWAVEG